MEKTLALATRFLKNKGHSGGSATASVEVLKLHLENLVGEYATKEVESRQIEFALGQLEGAAFMPLELQAATIIHWAVVRLGVKQDGALTRDDWDRLFEKVSDSVLECERRIIADLESEREAEKSADEAFNNRLKKALNVASLAKQMSSNASSKGNFIHKPVIEELRYALADLEDAESKYNELVGHIYTNPAG